MALWYAKVASRRSLKSATAWTITATGLLMNFPWPTVLPQAKTVAGTIPELAAPSELFSGVLLAVRPAQAPELSQRLVSKVLSCVRASPVGHAKARVTPLLKFAMAWTATATASLTTGRFLRQARYAVPLKASASKVKPNA
jgi:hypothetical protein